jgi:hypothetical protein
MSAKLSLLAVVLCSCSPAPPGPEEQVPVANAAGEARSAIMTGTASSELPATRTPLGTNGRLCTTCHGSTIGWGLNPEDDSASRRGNPRAASSTRLGAALCVFEAAPLAPGGGLPGCGRSSRSTVRPG